VSAIGKGDNDRERADAPSRQEVTRIRVIRVRLEEFRRFDAYD
jgi:hypothetical protein